MARMSPEPTGQGRLELLLRGPQPRAASQMEDHYPSTSASRNTRPLNPEQVEMPEPTLTRASSRAFSPWLRYEFHTRMQTPISRAQNPWTDKADAENGQCGCMKLYNLPSRSCPINAGRWLAVHITANRSVGLGLLDLRRPRLLRPVCLYS